MADSPGTLFDSLLDVMARLRGEQGCPWDREQTHVSLTPYLIEEAYEALEALEGGKRDAMMEELGDVLFQVVFHAQVARELGEFSMADLLERLVAKMVRRHPHVFGEAKVSTAGEAFSQWERIKHEEATQGGAPRSVLDGVPQSLPALLRAQRLQEKAARTGFDWKDPAGAWAKVKEEVGEVNEALAGGDGAHLQEELGDLLFAVVNVARLRGLDAEGCLRRAADKFRRRFMLMEGALAAEGKSPSEAPLEQMDRSWEAAKARERDAGGSESGRP
ncbi:MAG: nucleoside triphosphate pyrophosphohydrolase [Candidatus Rokubacteria bacterium]|nr:nucleoside triphosphate pyrophosphohydrolase [Candidatus Rokubacteria bacterium]